MIPLFIYVPKLSSYNFFLKNIQNHAILFHVFKKLFIYFLDGCSVLFFMVFQIKSNLLYIWYNYKYLHLIIPEVYQNNNSLPRVTHEILT